MTEDFVKIVADGAMRALILHGHNKGLNTDQLCERLPQLREIMKAEFSELKITLKNSLDARMGESMHRMVINTYCNAWAVKALTN